MKYQKRPLDKKRFVFGPVPSRRLGHSLGIDLVPLKTCTYDCIYCQLGGTNHKTAQRAEYAAVDDVLRDLEQALGKNPDPDFITLSGSGEPTLHSEIGAVIQGVRAITTLPVAVLTNGSLLKDDKVRAACSLADVVLPSLDAGDEETFQTVNRPVPGLSFKDLIDGLTAFRRDFRGQIWLEVLLIRSLTGSDTAVSKIADLANAVRPDRIHLNTAVRPTAEGYVQPVPVPDLQRYAGFFEPRAQFAFPTPAKRSGSGLLTGQLLEILQRRPCTLEGMAGILNIPPVQLTKYIDQMVSRGQLEMNRRGSDIYFFAASEKAAKT